MANADKPRGFRPYRYLNGSPWNGQARKYEVTADNSTAIFIGDLVELSSDDPTGDLGAVMVNNTTDAAVLGVLISVDPVRASNSLEGGGTNDLNLATTHVLAQTQYEVWVVDDPNVLFIAQEDSTSDPINASEIGLNFACTLTTGDTTTGQSKMEVDSDSHGTTATLPLRLMGIARKPNNVFDATTGQAEVIVKINNHQLNSGTGSVGV